MDAEHPRKADVKPVQDSAYRMTQKKSALVEQTAAAAALEEQPIGVAQEVETFKLPDGRSRG
jgi:hypothetical protein